MIAFMPAYHAFQLKFNHFNFEEIKLKINSFFCLIVKKTEKVKAKPGSKFAQRVKEDNQLYRVPQKNNNVSPELTTKVIENFVQCPFGKKLSGLCAATQARELPFEFSHHAARKKPEFLKTIVLESVSDTGIMPLIQLFKQKTQPHPIKMVNTGADAREWLKHYL